MAAPYIAVANVHNPGSPGDHQKQRIGGKIISLLKQVKDLFVIWLLHPRILLTKNKNTNVAL